MGETYDYDKVEEKTKSDQVKEEEIEKERSKKESVKKKPYRKPTQVDRCGMH